MSDPRDEARKDRPANFACFGEAECDRLWTARWPTGGRKMQTAKLRRWHVDALVFAALKVGCPKEGGWNWRPCMLQRRTLLGKQAVSRSLRDLEADGLIARTEPGQGFQGVQGAFQVHFPLVSARAPQGSAWRSAAETPPFALLSAGQLFALLAAPVDGLAARAQRPAAKKPVNSWPGTSLHRAGLMLGISLYERLQRDHWATSRARLAEIMGTSTASIDRALRSMQEMGLIARAPRYRAFSPSGRPSVEVFPGGATLPSKTIFWHDQCDAPAGARLHTGCGVPIEIQTMPERPDMGHQLESASGDAPTWGAAG